VSGRPGRGQEAREARGRRPEARGQRPGGQRPEARRPEARSQEARRPEVRGQRPEARGQRPEAGGRGQRPEAGGQRRSYALTPVGRPLNRHFASHSIKIVPSEKPRKNNGPLSVNQRTASSPIQPVFRDLEPTAMVICRNGC